MLAVKRLTAAEYFDLDARADGKLELWCGHPVAMAGASPEHNIIAGNILAGVHRTARPHGCFTFTSDQRVAVASGTYTYPDASVACDPRYDDARPASLLNPVLIVEVASDSTAQIDRIDKLDAYTHLDSVQAYWIVEQDRMFATAYTRRGDVWVVETLRTQEAVLACPRPELSLTLAEVYEGLSFEGPAA